VRAVTPAADAPLVSVVVPVRNDAQSIEASLESIRAQDHAPLELVAIHDRGAGAHATLDEGVRRSTGEWVAILHPGDRFAPTRIRALLSAARAAGSALAFSGARVVDASGREITREDWSAARLVGAQRGVGAAPSVGFALLARNVTLSTGNLLFRRELFDLVGGFRAFECCHDWDFVLRALLETEPVFCGEPLYEYRLRPEASVSEPLARRESAAVLKTFFTAVRRGAFRNALVPGPATWPGVFEAWLDAFGLRCHWDASARSPG
jgi:glycosyltransferase involved in cell wall biosynthesis